MPLPFGGHVGRKEQAGPHVLKLKHTWTKVTQMDVGPRKKIHETSPPKLGKRGMEEAYFE